MLKKIILTSSFVAVLSGFAISKPAQADTVSNDIEVLDVEQMTNLSAVTHSLDSLTDTMNQMVTTVAKQQPKLKSNKTQTNAEKIVNTAKKYLGVPYVWGGTTPAGFDCSGLTSYVYREALGKEIGRTTYDQMALGHSISTKQAKAGDLLIFFGGSHVGIYIGNGQFIHAPQPGQSVEVSSLSLMQADYALKF